MHARHIHATLQLQLGTKKAGTIEVRSSLTLSVIMEGRGKEEEEGNKRGKKWCKGDTKETIAEVNDQDMILLNCSNFITIA